MEGGGGAANDQEVLWEVPRASDELPTGRAPDRGRVKEANRFPPEGE